MFETSTGIASPEFTTEREPLSRPLPKASDAWFVLRVSAEIVRRVFTWPARFVPDPDFCGVGEATAGALGFFVAAVFILFALSLSGETETLAEVAGLAAGLIFSTWFAAPMTARMISSVLELLAAEIGAAVSAIAKDVAARP